MIPSLILSALHDRPLELYGDGGNTRNWIHVDDHVDALRAVATSAAPGALYCIGGPSERANLWIAEHVCAVLDDRHPRRDGRGHAEAIMFVRDRPGHDWRYAIDGSRIGEELGIVPARDLEQGLAATVDWYLSNPDWWRDMIACLPSRAA